MWAYSNADEGNNLFFVSHSATIICLSLIAHLLGHFCATRQPRRVVAAIFAIVGGFLPSNSLKKANCAVYMLDLLREAAHAVELARGRDNAYLSSGIASAMPRKLVSPYWRLRFTLSPIDFGGCSSSSAAHLSADSRQLRGKSVVPGTIRAAPCCIDPARLAERPI